MPSFAEPVPALQITSAAISTIHADLIAWPVFEEDDRDVDLAGAESALGAALTSARSTGEMRGRLYEMVHERASGWQTRRVLLVGCGRRSDLTVERARRVATAAALAARKIRAGHIAFVMTAGFPADLAQHVADGVTLAAFRSGRHKTEEAPSDRLTALTLVVEAGADAEAAASRGQIIADCCNRARALADEPGNHLPPRVFAARAVEALEGSSIRTDIIDERGLEKLGMGLLLGVGRGSVEPPRLLVMRYEPKGAPASPMLGLVGKGVTFDTGGISIKPAEGMERMKDDMAGGASVVAAMRAIGLLGAPQRVIGVVPMAENMPGGKAIRPGDVLTSASGKTVEVINTDAEGRLILADGLWFAAREGATHLVDVATLTGACVVALGRVHSGLFGHPESWRDTVARAAQAAGDRLWPMPTDDDYFEQLKSEIADMMNVGGRPGGAVTAAVFLKQFAGGRPWAHLDIAATAWAEEAKPWQPKGATSVAVRTLIELALRAPGA
ncbi:MAG: leucyl aminopeptidase [Acidobacteriota bacterium]|nr:leucyl aminopeptidase [Acidobacteriota bacterium]